MKKLQELHKRTLFRRHVSRASYRAHKIFKRLDKKQTRNIFGLISEHAPLNKCRWKLGWKVGDKKVQPWCANCYVPESVDHYIFKCKMFKKQRKRCISKLQALWPDFDERKHFIPKYILFGNLYEQESGYVGVPRNRQVEIYIYIFPILSTRQKGSQKIMRTVSMFSYTKETRINSRNGIGSNYMEL